MIYIYQSTGEKITLRQIRKAHPDVSIPDGADLTHLGYAALEEVERPSLYATEGVPEEYEPGRWRQTWVFDPDADLANAKARKYQERLDALLEARNSGFEYNGKLIDSDQESRMLISGVVQLATLALMSGTPEALAQFAASLGAGWRHSDGTIAATDAAGMIAIGQALAARIAYCDAVSQAHKAAIEACETAEQLNALDITTGY